jgi:serine/threonine protein kinase
MDFAYSLAGTRTLLSKATIAGVVRYKVNFANFLMLMQSYGVPGPNEYEVERDYLTDFQELGRFGWSKIGEGAQFEVFAQAIQDGIVLKRVKRVYLQDEELLRAERLRLGLRALEIEIRSLGRVEVAHHPNIVDLVHWGLDWSSNDRRKPQPVLCVERAVFDLSVLSETTLFFQDGISQWKGRYHLSLDIAAGLQCLHDCKIVHGDLKPANILIFRSDNPLHPWVAKLSDFGLSVEAQEFQTTTSLQYHGTIGWIPPEVGPDGPAAIPLERLSKCDSYAFGLVSLYIFYSWPGSNVSSRDLSLLDAPGAMLKTALEAIEGSGIYYASDITQVAHVCNMVVKNFLVRDPGLRKDVNFSLLRIDHKDFDQW